MFIVSGQGRYGTVWLGHLRDKPVAVKMFPSHYQQYFYNEKDIYSLPFMDHTSLLTYFGEPKDSVCSNPHSSIRQAFSTVEKPSETLFIMAHNHFVCVWPQVMIKWRIKRAWQISSWSYRIVHWGLSKSTWKGTLSTCWHSPIWRSPFPLRWLFFIPNLRNKVSRFAIYPLNLFQIQW